jgi:hypothetical protein
MFTRPDYFSASNETPKKWHFHYQQIVNDKRDATMVVLIIGSVLLGATLARFFNLLILVPASAVILAVVVARSAYLGRDLLHLVLDYAALTASVEIGYGSSLIRGLWQRTREWRSYAAPDSHVPIKAIRRRFWFPARDIVASPTSDMPSPRWFSSAAGMAVQLMS